jgi:nicotinamidase-related amidase
MPPIFDARRTALLVIDMQRDFCAPGGYADRAGLDIARLAVPVASIGRLLAAARRAGVRVIHTREGHLPDLSDCPPEKLARSQRAGAPIGSAGPMGRLLVRGEYGHGIIDALAPGPGEAVIDKPGYGAFHRTALGDLLAAADMHTLIFCGVTTEVCVHSSVREAVDRGFRCWTVGDATAASEPALQAPALAMLGVEGGLFGAVIDTDAAVLALDAAGPSRPGQANRPNRPGAAPPTSLPPSTPHENPR